jgi:NADH:ubiquinone oxidoreductase subunit
MLKFLNWLVTWWNGHTIGTWIYTKRHGRLVGEDVFGNAYYQTADGKRRWVLYKNIAEASMVPAEWHGWLHHTVDNPPTVEPPKVKPWEREHRPNLTGTPLAQKPSGSLAASGQRPHATGDYEAWQPK